MGSASRPLLLGQINKDECQACKKSFSSSTAKIGVTLFGKSGLQKKEYIQKWDWKQLEVDQDYDEDGSGDSGGGGGGRW